MGKFGRNVHQSTDPYVLNDIQHYKRVYKIIYIYAHKIYKHRNYTVAQGHG